MTVHDNRRPEDTCRQCGKCCYAEIPVTVPDLERLATALGIGVEEAFGRFIQEKPSGLSSVFKIRKRLDRACILLGPDKRCTVHDHKPIGCSLYTCAPDTDETGPGGGMREDRREREIRMFEYAVARQLTAEYIRTCGTAYDGRAYRQVLQRFRERSSDDGRNKVCLGRHTDGTPLAMVYDCSTCPQRNRGAVETPVTIDDIDRLMRHGHMEGAAFFDRYIAAAPGGSSGSFQLIRDPQCVFFKGPETHCAVETVRPMHCRFTPCPLRAESEEVYRCLYLGSGSIEEQFRHQVALEYSRAYIREYGITYDPAAFRQALDDIRTACADHARQKAFTEKIGPFRYSGRITE